MVNKCKECGCACRHCMPNDHDVHLHVEIENLKQKLLERENHIVTMETNFLNEANKFPSGEMVALREELLVWQDKYRRLYDAHRRVQRVNQGLEDKLLKLVDVSETDKSTLTKDIAVLSQKLAEANYTIKKLSDDNEKYKSDVSLAIQFLQCKQGNFVAHKFESLPPEVQSQVSSFMSNKKKPEEKKPEMKSIKVPIPTFPPTAMVYSIPKSPKPDRKEEIIEQTPTVDIVSAAIMAKVLEERQKEKAFARHCDSCTCSKKLQIVYDINCHTVGTQTGDYKNMLCLRCNDHIISSSIRIVRNNENVVKKVPIYPNNENAQEISMNGNNIVKVQPNNFLIEVTDNQQIPQSNESSSNKESETVEHHHRLCNKESPGYEVDSVKDKNSDKVSAKIIDNDLKGPRYCSMRLQSGTKNILLDNAHNNVAPVLYTRHHHHHHHHHNIHSSQKKDNITIKSPDVSKQSQTESYSSGDKNNVSIVSENSSIRNQERVADWIKNNLDNDIHSSDNSQSIGGSRDNLISEDRVRLAEMEENVKRFLFGESEFLKTMELGKMKYRNYRDSSEDVVKASNINNSKSNSHTETEI